MDDHIVVSRSQMLALIMNLTDGFPNPDDPMPDGPWGPIIRQIIEALGPSPEPWRAARQRNRLAIVGQPRATMPTVLAATFAQHIAQLHELAAVLPEESAMHVRQVADERLSRYLDDCGTNIMQERIAALLAWLRKHGHRVPPPPPEPYSIDLMRMGVQWINIATLTQDQQAAGALRDAGGKLIEMGFNTL